MGTEIPAAAQRFAGSISRLAADSVPEKSAIRYPPAHAPNVVVVMLDDVGFGACSTFGGPVPTPTLDRVAGQGLAYNQFHTTALCSPTRAALLTGRNHHSAHFGGISEIAYGFPGYDCVIPNSTAMVAETLRGNGYSTAMFGKWHLTPMWELGPAGPFDRWPTGMGFEHFYGFLGGEASQYEPALYEGTTPIAPYEGREDYHLTEDLSDQCIAWLRRQKASAPHKPFFVYYAPGATHSPHHVWPEWIASFTGTFDEGWDRLREDIYQRQLALGVIPEDTRLTPRPEQIPAWDDYPERYRPVAARLMEVYAGFLAHTDTQVGRLVDALEDLGEWDNTLFFYITGDNGASAEGTVHGAWSAPSFQNGVPEDPEWLLEHLDDLGSRSCENHYNVAWAWALDTPFQWTKQVASHFGGTRNALAVSWPRGIAEPGGLRSQFHHVIDVVPTILEVVGIEQPRTVNGIEQKPLEGVSMRYTFDDADASSRHTTQYFEILGNRAIYHDGWIASCFHGRLPWTRSQAVPFDAPPERWELYDIRNDFSQADDLAATHPERLAELQQLFDAECRAYDVYPLSDQTTARALPHNRPSYVDGVTTVTLYDDCVRLPELASVNVKNTSFTITAHLTVPAGVDGVVVCQGGSMAGWSLYVESGIATFAYNWLGHELTLATSAVPLPIGDVELGVRFRYDGGGLGKGGDVDLTVDGRTVARSRVERTVPFVFSMSGETLDVGRSTGTSVAPYPLDFPFSGTIHRVEITIDPQLRDGDADGVAEGVKRAAESSH